MIHSQNQKFVNVCPPGVIKDDASFVCPAFDREGWDYLTVVVILGATDIAAAALKLQEDDALNSTDLASGTDITGLVWGTSADIAGVTSTLPAAGDDNLIFAFDVDLRGRKRYLQLVATAGNGSAGTYLAAVGILSRGKQLPTTAAQRGCKQVLRA